MPAFTFEKLSPPLRRDPAVPRVVKPRGLVFQLLDRLVEARARRRLRNKNAKLASQTKSSS
jgi:hypothetical protein